MTEPNTLGSGEGHVLCCESEKVTLCGRSDSRSHACPECIERSFGPYCPLGKACYG